MLPGLGEDARGLTLEKPVNVGRPGQEYAAQDETEQRVGMGLRISQRQRRTPGAAEYHPAVDFEKRPDFFQIFDQVPGRIFLETGVGSGFAAAALIEQDDAISLGIEKTPVARLAGAPRSAMQK